MSAVFQLPVTQSAIYAMRASALLLGALAAAAVAIPAPHNYVLHERRDVLPTSWSEGERIYRKASLPMRIGLTQSNLDRGHDLLMEVYVWTPMFVLSGG